MSKQVIILKIEGKEVAVGIENRRCLYELCQRYSIEQRIVYVDDSTSVLDLSSLVDFINGESEYTSSIEEVERTLEGLPDFSCLTTWQKAEALRLCLKKRLIDNNYPTEGQLQPHSFSLQEIDRYWNTGLSRGGLSRHLKKVGEELSSRGYRILSRNGTYRLLPST